MFGQKNKSESNKVLVTKNFFILKKSEEVAIDIINKVNSNKYKNITLQKINEESEKLINRVKRGASLDGILVEAFALAYKAVEYKLNIKLFKVQLMGAYILHLGDSVEMKTGEGKTYAAILPAYLNALTGKGVHIITVNEYLCERDLSITEPVFSALGLTSGKILRDMEVSDKKKNYLKDIIYSTNSEIGFDYLRDNLVKKIEDKMQRKLNYAIVDEVDSILIDEARTPLILSGGSFISEEEYLKADNFVHTLNHNDYKIDKEYKRSFLLKSGISKAEKFYKLENLFSNKNSIIVHRIVNSLQANFIFKFDIDYTVREDEIVLIDIFTGRLLEGRQFSEGLNQAIEAKEIKKGVTIKPETKVFASITYQNLFRMYVKLSGMSGTILQEEEELIQIYNMRAVGIPTNRILIRKDKPDLVFATKKGKNDYLIAMIKKIHKTSQPILVGTRSVVDSEFISKKLKKLNVKHEVLNAKNHLREAEIISKAGTKNAITISTNMAGRGTDIKLGDGVKELGGLFVIGTERHESRRIDNQLRGRSGRQGDIGYSQFLISLQDEIILRSGMNKFAKFSKGFDINPIESKMLTRSITSAQKKIEGLNYDSRKNIVEYDDVVNNQRMITYRQRDQVLSDKNIDKSFLIMIDRFIEKNIDKQDFYVEGNFNADKFLNWVNNFLGLIGVEIKNDKKLNKEELANLLKVKLKKMITMKFDRLQEQTVPIDIFIKDVIIMSIDANWTNQLERLIKLKSGISYRQFAQKNPVQVYVLESRDLFEIFKLDFLNNAVRVIFVANPKLKSKVKSESKDKITKDLIVK